MGMSQAKRDKQRLDHRRRNIECSQATAKIIAKATAHRVIEHAGEYVPITDASRTHQDAGTWNYARQLGYARR